MLKTEKPLKIFGVKNADLKHFAKEAKRYGIRYCVLHDKDAKANDLIDIMAKVEDAPKLDRILEWLEFMSVDRAEVESNLAEGKEAQEITDTDALVELLIDDEGKPMPDSPTTEKATEAAESEQDTQVNPTQAKTESGVPSEPTSNLPSRTENTGTNKKPSVKEFL